MSFLICKTLDTADRHTHTQDNINRHCIFDGHTVGNHIKLNVVVYHQRTVQRVSVNWCPLLFTVT